MQQFVLKQNSAVLYGEDGIDTNVRRIKSTRRVPLPCVSAMTFFLLLLAASFFPTSALAQSWNSFPFDGTGFTVYNATDSYIDLMIPFHDDREAHRRLRGQDAVSTLEFYNGSVWTKILEFYTDDNGVGTWHWFMLKKVSSSIPKVETYETRVGRNYWTEVRTDWTDCNYARENQSARSNTYAKVRIYYGSTTFGNRPIAFRFNANVYNGGEFAAT
jgi:hypothetical protein